VENNKRIKLIFYIIIWRDFKMEIIKRKDQRAVYTVIDRGNHFAVVKVMNIYKDEKEAMDNMIKLVRKEISEEDLLQEYTKSEW
jgi:hypothetical protein